jgi:hypothetical protein
MHATTHNYHLAETNKHISWASCFLNVLGLFKKQMRIHIYEVADE